MTIDVIAAPPRRRTLQDALVRIAEATAPAPSAPDPVQIAVLAIESIGPASLRACATGAPVQVRVPDEAMAAVLRTALAETARSRSTDRLIDIVVDSSPGHAATLS